MPTECSAEPIEFAAIDRRAVVAGFDGGAITSDAWALLLVAADRAIGLVDRLAGCFIDHRREELMVHLASTPIDQRVGEQWRGPRHLP